jgi:uncharacterized membrane protein (DUF106 family)
MFSESIHSLADTLNQVFFPLQNIHDLLYFCLVTLLLAWVNLIKYPSDVYSILIRVSQKI